MFGDSITEFAFDQQAVEGAGSGEGAYQFALGAALQNRYARRLQVLHRGFSGYTSRQGVSLARGILACEHDGKPEMQRVRLAYVFFGTNDARRRGTSPENNQHVPLDQYVANMMAIVDEFETRQIPLVVVLPTFHDQRMWSETHPEDLKTGDFRSTELNRAYGRELAKACAKKGVPVVDLMGEMARHAEGVLDAKEADQTTAQTEDLATPVIPDCSLYLRDGVHFTGLGYHVFYDALVRTIAQSFPHLEHMSIPQQFPYRRDITFESLDELSGANAELS